MSGICKANQRQNSKRKTRYAVYEAAGRREINKALKLMKHLRKLPDDKVAMKALSNISDSAKRSAERKYNQACSAQ